MPTWTFMGYVTFWHGVQRTLLWSFWQKEEFQWRPLIITLKEQLVTCLHVIICTTLSSFYDKALTRQYNPFDITTIIWFVIITNCGDAPLPTLIVCCTLSWNFNCDFALVVHKHIWEKDYLFLSSEKEADLTLTYTQSFLYFTRGPGQKIRDS